MTGMKHPGIRPLLLGAGVLAFILAPRLFSFYVDWLWFGSVELAQVFATSFKAQAFWTLAGGLLGFLPVYASHLALVRATRGRVLTVSFQNQELIQLNVPKHLDRLALVAPALAAFAVGSLFAGNWRTFLFQANATAFGSADPVFGRDISFYVFSLPVLEVVGGALALTLGIALLAAAAMYVLKGALLFTGRGISAERAVSVHLSVLGSLLFLALAFNTFVGMHAVLSSTRGLVAGATYVDVNARLPLMNPQIGLAVLAAALILANIYVRRTLLVVAGVGAYLAVAVVGGVVYPALLHKFVVAPNELVKETPYIRRNIAATRKAFGLDSVEERNISGQSGLVREDVERNAATIANIRLWDHRPLLDTFSQVQEIRTYYDFTTVSNDRYLVNGEYRQTMLSPRELSSDSIPTKNWINETLTFTHGYGLTLGPVTQVTPEGLPVLLVKDIPPVSTAREIKVTRPEIYYGKLSSSHVIVNTKSKEFDYPAGEDNVFTEYAGAGGVKIDSLLRKLAFTVHFGSMKLLLSNDITSREPGPLSPEHRRACRAGLPVPAARQRPAHGGRGRRAPGLDVRRLHGEQPLPLRAAGRRRRQLHQELGEDHRRRLRREPEVLPRRPRGPDRADHRQGLPGRAAPPRRDARGPAPPRPLPAGHLRGADGGLLDVPHGGPAELLQPRGPVGDPGAGLRGPARGDGALLHDHEAARGEAGGVHPDAPLQPEEEGQPLGLDGGAQRRGRLREDGRLPLPEGPAGLRPEADRRADQPGHRDLAAGLALGPARLAGHAGDAARDPRRELADLRPAAVPARGVGQDPGAEKGDRGLREQDRDGGDAGARARANLRRERGRGAGCDGGVAAGAAAPGGSGLAPAASGGLAAQAREHYDRR